MESAPGKGSLFRVEIPVLTVERSDIPTSGIRRGPIIGLEPGQPEYRILVVEDHEENWLLLRRLLEKTGFQVQVAEDATTGIEKFLTWRPHFIWMDWRLPGMNGLEATRRIRELDGGEAVKIAILSAFAFTEYRDVALVAGVNDFVSKPFQADDMFDCLARHLGVRYTYQATAPEKTAASLDQEQLADLPAELRKELTDAVISLDIARIAAVIGRISEQNAALGSILSEYADRYAYSSILRALRSSEAVQT